MVLSYDTELMPLTFEVGPSRPPSESQSLLIRATRSCPWNRCEFCTTNKGRKFELRAVGDIKRDLDTVRLIEEQIKELAWRRGYGDSVKEVAASIYENPITDGYRVVALWLYFDAQRVFLQDANTLIMRTPDLVEVIRHLKQTLPSVTRVTSYGRSKTAARKSLEELKELYGAGLSRLHVGLESGCDEVLKFVQKGVTAEEHIKGGRKVVESGMSLSEYIMPGIGGKRWAKEHTAETAKVLNAINPDFIRLRSLVLRDDLPLYQKWRDGKFELLSDDEVVEEIAEIIQELEVTSYLASDHIENLLPDVEGKLPQDKEKILAVIKKYQALSEGEKINFRLGRRAGYYNSLDELHDPIKYERVEQILRGIKLRGEDVEDVILSLKKGYLV